MTPRFGFTGFLSIPWQLLLRPVTVEHQSWPWLKLQAARAKLEPLNDGHTSSQVGIAKYVICVRSACCAVGLMIPIVEGSGLTFQPAKFLPNPKEWALLAFVRIAEADPD